MGVNKDRNAEFIRQETVTGTVPMLTKDRQYPDYVEAENINKHLLKG